VGVGGSKIGQKVSRIICIFVWHITEYHHKIFGGFQLAGRGKSKKAIENSPFKHFGLKGPKE